MGEARLIRAYGKTRGDTTRISQEKGKIGGSASSRDFLMTSTP